MARIECRGVGTGGAADGPAGSWGSDAPILDFHPDAFDELSWLIVSGLAFCVPGLLAKGRPLFPAGLLPIPSADRLDAPGCLLMSSPGRCFLAPCDSCPNAKPRRTFSRLTLARFPVNHFAQVPQNARRAHSEDHTRNFVICKKDRVKRSGQALEPRFSV